MVNETEHGQRDRSGCSVHGCATTLAGTKRFGASDQGSQFGSGDWLGFCRANNLEPSMSRRGNCWDNAAMESFFGSLKKERIKNAFTKQ